MTQNPVSRAAERAREARSTSGTHAVPQGLSGTHGLTVVFVMVSLPGPYWSALFIRAIAPRSRST